VELQIEPFSESPQISFLRAILLSCPPNGKVEVQVYDYVDSSVPMLAKMHDKRMKGFKTMGYEQH
jgi:hypothetical protein